MRTINNKADEQVPLYILQHERRVAAYSRRIEGLYPVPPCLRDPRQGSGATIPATLLDARADRDLTSPPGHVVVLIR